METDLTRPTYPVLIEVKVPERFQRVQLLVRLLVLVSVGMIHQSDVGLFGLLYFLLPVVAAVLITHRSGSGYLEHDAPWLVAVLEWVLGFYAYMLFVTDTFPLGREGRVLRLRVWPRGCPSVWTAVSRLVTSLPHVIVLMVVGIVACIASVIAALGVLVFESCAEGLRSFQQEAIGLAARLLSYHASLVDTYPPLFAGVSSTSIPHARSSDDRLEPRAADHS